jgi:transposase
MGMRPIGHPDELERRRRRAVLLVQQGESPTAVARILGVQRTSVHRWLRLASSGPDGLSAKPILRQPRLSDDQLVRLEALLLQGAHAHGWPNQLWTADRVATLIGRHFLINYHPEHVRKVLKHRLGWTSQKPRRRARERNDKEVERWKDDEFRRIAREAWQRSAHLIFLDESGFMLTPTVRRSLAPRGCPAVLDCWDRRDRISAISCITISPEAARPNLFFDLMPDNKTVHATDTVDFLSALKRHIPGPWTIIWDRSNVHSKALLVRAWLAEHPEVVVENFPGYAPDLNPDELVWGWTKYGRLANLAAFNTDELRDRIIDELCNLKEDRNMLKSFINHVNLPLQL